MADYLLTQSDKLEFLEALVTRFRSGEIGPLVFRAECEALRIDRDTIDALRNEFVQECADNIRKNGGL